MFRRLWEAWKRLAHLVGNFQARVLLTLVYFVLVLPFGLAVRLWADPLRIKRRQVEWLSHPNDPTDMDWARRQG